MDRPDGIQPSNTAEEESVEVRGQASRGQSPLGILTVGVIALAIMIWLLAGRTPVDDQPLTGDEVAQSTTTAATATTRTNLASAEPSNVPSMTGPQSGSSTSTATTNNASVGSQLPEADPELAGWRLVIGDGRNVDLVDLATGERQHNRAVGAPLAADGNRLLMYQNSQLFWLETNDLVVDVKDGADLVAGVPTLQVMFVRPRSADRPTLVDGETTNDAAIWWPNNNSDPQRWIKIRLVGGAVLDEIALSSEVFGGPDIVATLGSGTFERVNGKWQSVGDFFATSASPQAVFGQRCVSPEQCEPVIVDRSTRTIEALSLPTGGTLNATLIADADRVILVTTGGFVDYPGGRFVPLAGLDVEALVVNRGPLLAATSGVTVGDEDAVVMIHHIDRNTRIQVEVDLPPQWMVLMPPS